MGDRHSEFFVFYEQICDNVIVVVAVIVAVVVAVISDVNTFVAVSGLNMKFNLANLVVLSLSL